MIYKVVDRTKFQIDISRIVHRGDERILLSFPYDTSLIQLIKGIEGRKYTKTYKGWHLPYAINSLIKLRDLNIDFSIKQCDRNDPIFLQFEEHRHAASESFSLSIRFDRKVGFLIDTFLDSHREILKGYIYYLYNEGYSWTGIKYFAQYAFSYLKGEDKGFIIKSKHNLDGQDYNRMQNMFLEFRNQK